MKSEVFFGDEKLKATYEELKNSKTEERQLYNWIYCAIDDLEKNAFCGIQIPKRLIPREYVSRYAIDNLWKYNMPNAWRLLYSIGRDGVVVVSIILEWMNHKDYERRFKY